MSIQSSFDEILEDMECPNSECRHVGMRSIGGWSYECPECGYEGTYGE